MIAKYFFVLACLCNGFKLKYRQLTGVELIHKSILLHSSGYQSYDVSVKETNLLKFCKSYCQIILPDFFSNENPIIFYLSIDGVNFSRMKLIGVTITDYSDTEEYEDIARKNSNVEAAMYIYDNFGLSGIVAATSENANALHSKRVEIERYILTQAAYRLIFGSKNTSANSDYSRTTNSGSSSLREVCFLPIATKVLNDSFCLFCSSKVSEHTLPGPTEDPLGAISFITLGRAWKSCNLGMTQAQ